MPAYSKPLVRELGKNVQADFAKRLVDESTDKAYSLSELGLNDRTEEYFVPLTSLVQAAAWKDALPDAPNGTTLGLGDAAASVVTGTTTNSGATATATETAGFLYTIPENYVAGEDLTVRVRAKVSDSRDTASPLDVVAKLISADGALGSDICATAEIDIAAVVAYADQDFTITGTTLTPGAQLWVTISVETTDTAEAANGTPTVAAVSVLVPQRG